MSVPDVLERMDGLFHRIAAGVVSTVAADGRPWDQIRYSVMWDLDGVSEANLASVAGGQTRYHFAPLQTNDDLRALWAANQTLLRPWSGWVLRVDREGECKIEFTYAPSAE